MGFWSRLREAFIGFDLGPASGLESPVNQVAVSIPIGGRSQPRSPSYNLQTLIQDGYAGNVVVYCCVNEIATSVAGLPLIARERAGRDRDNDNPEALPQSHPLHALLDNPHPDYSTFALFETVLIHLQTAGVAYVHKGRNSTGQVIQLQPLRPDRVKPFTDNEGKIAGYEYKPDSMSKATLIPRRDMISFLLPDPTNDYYGLPPLAVCARYGDLDTEAGQFMLDFFLNGGVPSGLLKLKTNVTPDERKKVQEQWADMYGRGARSTKGRGEWGKIGVINADVDYQDIGSMPDKLRLDSVWGMTESRICATFKVPAVLVQVRIGMQFSTYANYETALRAFWTETLIPMYQRISDSLTHDLASEWPGNIEIVFDTQRVPSLQEAEDAKSLRAERQFSAGIISRNEARARIGEDLLAQDIILVPMGATPLTTGAPNPLAPGQTRLPVAAPEALPLGGRPLLGMGTPPSEALPFGSATPAPARASITLASRKSRRNEVLAKGDDKAVREVIDAKLPALKRAVQATIKDLRSGVRRGALMRSIKARDKAGALKATGWDEWGDRYAEVLRSHIVSVFQAAGRATYGKVAGDERLEAMLARETHEFSDRSADLKRWVNQHVAEEVGRTLKDGRATIREQVLKVLEGDRTLEQAADAIRDVIGLTRQQADRVRALEERLVGEGKSPKAVADAAEKYSNRLLDERADMIAENETARAASKAQKEAWGQMVKDGVIDEAFQKMWVIDDDERTCPICEELDGQVVDMEELFSSDEGEFDAPPEPHINCRCDIVLVQERTAEENAIYKPQGEVVVLSNPYHIERRGENFCVVASKTGKVVGDHPSKAKAIAHLRALEANVPEARS